MTRQMRHPQSSNCAGNIKNLMSIGEGVKVRRKTPQAKNPKMKSEMVRIEVSIIFLSLQNVFNSSLRMGILEFKVFSSTIC